jgi:uroporphyrinogen-III decarboxylase
MFTQSDIFKRLFSQNHIPKGELWLGNDLFRLRGITNDVKGNLLLARLLNLDVLCLPVTDNLKEQSNLNYKYFDVKDLTEVKKQSDIVVAVIVNGNWQRLATKHGLKNLLRLWHHNKRGFQKDMEKDQPVVIKLVKDSIDKGAEIIIIADDLAGDHGLLISPQDIADYCKPFWDEIVRIIHEKQKLVLFHSCGLITAMIPHILDCSFDGMAAIENIKDNLIVLIRNADKQKIIMTGIDGQLMTKSELSDTDYANFEKLLLNLSDQCMLVLSTSPGLYTEQDITRVKALHEFADAAYRKLS